MLIIAALYKEQLWSVVVDGINWTNASAVYHVPSSDYWVLAGNVTLDCC
jgi:hypothetical protein